MKNWKKVQNMNKITRHFSLNSNPFPIVCCGSILLCCSWLQFNRKYNHNSQPSVWGIHPFLHSIAETGAQKQPLNAIKQHSIIHQHHCRMKSFRWGRTSTWVHEIKVVLIPRARWCIIRYRCNYHTLKSSPLWKA